jgi:sulfotransferase
MGGRQVTAFHFMAGLPRSGSTLLSALLGQRPDLYAPGITNTPGLLEAVNTTMQADEGWKLGTSRTQHDNAMRGLLPLLYADRNEPVILDKSRLWGIPYYVDMATQVLGRPPKIIAPVRPLDEIVASFIRLCRMNPGNFLDAGMRAGNISSQYRKPLDDARVDTLLMPNEHIGLSMLSLHAAYQPQTAHLFHVVNYADLTDDPVKALRGVEEFLGLEPYEYDLTRIEGVAYNDAALGMAGMHDVRPTISRRDPAPDEVLSEYALQRCRLEDFWTGRER